MNPLFWEPACGDGRLIRWIKESGRRADGTDLALGQGIDFLKDESMRSFIITNPPFSLGAEFVAHSLAHATETMFLLPLNFLGSQKRAELFRRNEPDAIFVLSNRPSFGLNKHGKKGTDSNEYGWFYWGDRYKGIQHLCTPARRVGTFSVTQTNYEPQGTVP